MHLGSNRRISAKPLSRSSSYLWYESLLRQERCEAFPQRGTPHLRTRDEIRSISPSKPFLRWVLLRDRLMVGRRTLNPLILARPHTQIFGDRLAVGRHALDVETGVRIPVPELLLSVGVKIQVPQVCAEEGESRIFFVLCEEISTTHPLQTVSWNFWRNREDFCNRCLRDRSSFCSRTFHSLCSHRRYSCRQDNFADSWVCGFNFPITPY